MLVRCLVALGVLLAPSLAAADDGLRDHMTVTTARDADGDEWTWLSLRNPRELAALPANWVLHVDQARFTEIAIVATSRDGTRQRIVRGSGQLAQHWAPGGVLSFTVATPGRDVVGLQIGLERLDDVALLRKIVALSPPQAARLDAHWLLMMGVFCGLLISAFVYNLFVYAGQRYTFLRWYLAWVAASLAYGLVWTNMAALALPDLIGPPAVRLNMVLVGLVVALGSNFLVTVLEDGKAPRKLLRLVRVAGMACFVSGAMAAADPWFDPSLSDLLLNLSMLTCVIGSLAALAVAARRGSRVVWLYLVGWAPVIAVYACRAARNFGLMEQSDIIDMATFVALGYESLVFSLVIADRFISLRRQRDVAEANARGMEIERETLRRAAHADFLTGLGNRAFFHEQLRDLHQRSTPFSLFLLDIDYLKELNDRQGHDAGDALLQHVGALLARLENATTHCARVGGDEFAVLIEGSPADCEATGRALDELQGGIWARNTWSGNLSLSIGGASAHGSPSPADLFQRADIALYEAKKHGRGRRAMFSERLQRLIQERIDLIKQAHRGLQQGEFLLHFQPIIDVRSSTLVSVEALLRWKHPERGLIGPNDFQPVLADKEIGAALQDRVIDLALEELRRRPQFTGTMSVNFTALDLGGREAARKLLRKLAAMKVAPSSLCVEVTEGIILGKGGNQPAAALRELHAAGVKIALDDFGTGYASLVHLKEIPVDTLKIDRSFVAGLLDEGDESEEIVRAVLALGHGLNKTVIAEGVETLPQLLRLRELGCDFAQGFLFGRPSPAFPSVTVKAAA